MCPPSLHSAHLLQFDLESVSAKAKGCHGATIKCRETHALNPPAFWGSVSLVSVLKISVSALALGQVSGQVSGWLDVPSLVASIP